MLKMNSAGCSLAVSASASRSRKLTPGMREMPMAPAAIAARLKRPRRENPLLMVVLLVREELGRGEDGGAGIGPPHARRIRRIGLVDGVVHARIGFGSDRLAVPGTPH